MKYLFLTFSLLLVVQSKALSQNVSTDDTLKLARRKDNILFILKMPDGKEFKTYDALLNNEDATDFKFIGGKELIDYSPLNAKFGLVYNLKPDIKFLNRQRVLEKFKIDPAYRDFKIAINDMELTNPTDLLVSQNFKFSKIVAYKQQHTLNFLTNSYDKISRDRKTTEEQRQKNIQLYQQAHPRQ